MVKFNKTSDGSYRSKDGRFYITHSKSYLWLLKDLKTKKEFGTFLSVNAAKHYATEIIAQEEIPVVPSIKEGLSESHIS